MSESVFRHKDQLSFDSLFDELTEENSQEESQNNIRFIHRKRKSFPFHLVADFNRFMEFIAHRSILLSETTSYMSGNQLSEINNRLTINVLKETEQTKQQHYPYIHFFYNISLAGNLTEIQTTHSGELKLMTTAKLKLFRNLTDTEQYFFLLETFWVDVDWAKLLHMGFNPIHRMLPEIFEKLTDSKSNSQLDFAEKETLLGHIIADWNYFFLYMEWFGFWVCEEDTEKLARHKQGYFVKNSRDGIWINDDSNPIKMERY